MVTSLCGESLTTHQKHKRKELNMLQYMRWDKNQRGMADSISILSSKRAESLVRKFDQIRNEEMEADPLWFWQTLLKYRRIPPSSS